MVGKTRVGAKVTIPDGVAKQSIAVLDQKNKAILG